MKQEIRLECGTVRILDIPMSLRERAGGQNLIIMEREGVEPEYAIASREADVSRKVEYFVKSLKQNTEKYIEGILDKIEEDAAKTSEKIETTSS